MELADLGSVLFEPNVEMKKVNNESNLFADRIVHLPRKYARARRYGVPLADDFWLRGDFTQNLPCKGDGSDPAEAKVKVDADRIVSKVGVCKFLNAKLEGKRLKATMECQFPAGPLVGDVTFTQKTNGTVDFVDRDNDYTATLYRCPK